MGQDIRTTRTKCDENTLRNCAGVCLSVFLLVGCGSAYTGIVDSSGLGSGQYIPSVYVEPGQEEKYKQVLGICRNVANNRQMTAAQEAQLATLTDTAQSTVQGAAMATQMGQIFDMAGVGGVKLGEAAGIGAGVGLVTGLVGSMSEGAKKTAAETKLMLLRCLKVASKNGKLWQVLE